MNQQNQEIIIRCLGVLEALSFVIPGNLKPIVELVTKSLSFALDNEESEKDNDTH